MIWKKIESHPNYSIDNKGLIINRHGNTLKPFIDKGGYKCVDLWNNKKRKHFLIHVLVLTYWDKPRPPGLKGRHLKNKQNNFIGDLVWS